MQPKRQTAYKFWIKDLAEAEAQVNNEGMMFFKVRDKEVIRVNVLANVIHKYVSETGNYVFITLDDGSGQVRLKAWGDDTNIIGKIEIGDSVLCVGKLGLNNNEVFLRPEAVKKIDNPDWELVRKLELIKLYGKVERSESVAPTSEDVSEKPIVEEVVVSDSPSNAVREKVVSMIEKAPAEGIEEGELVKEVGGNEEEVEKVVQALLSEGEIFQPRKGYLKLIG